MRACFEASENDSNISFLPNVAFSRGTGWRGLCPAQTVTDRTVGYNAWLAEASAHACLPARLYSAVPLPCYLEMFLKYLFPIVVCVAETRLNSHVGDGAHNANAKMQLAIRPETEQMHGWNVWKRSAMRVAVMASRLALTGAAP